jgi:hypothetical protein
MFIEAMHTNSFCLQLMLDHFAVGGRVYRASEPRLGSTPYSKIAVTCALDRHKTPLWVLRRGRIERSGGWDGDEASTIQWYLMLDFIGMML